MALTPRLDLRQSQALVMTPQLQQAIKLLQFSNIELSTYVEQQLEQNPLLERDESASEEFGADARQPDDDGADRIETGEFRSVDTAVAGDTPMDPGSALDMDGYDNLYDVEHTQMGGGETGFSNPGGESGWQGRGGSFDDYESGFENTLSARPTLREHLAGQLAMDIDDPVDRIIGAHLIDQLDEAGYISDDFAPIAQALGCSVERVEATLRRLQQFDPAGIFARSLAECLTLQLGERDRLDTPMQALLANLEVLALRDWPALTKACGVGPERISKMVAEIQSLNPKPALAFDHDVAQTVTPDIFMRPQAGGGWIVELNNETLPRVLVNNHYYARISREVRDKGEKQYINECLQSASWLVKSLHQRATTILKVSTEIIRQQDGFFVAGIRGLRPLILRDVAEAIEMHESTVSRVTSNKFMATPRGIYELKYFFTNAIGSSDGGDTHSSESVRHRIKALIDTETAKTVLSDDALAETLQKEGIDIARRTVAKYREAMRIPSSVRRRREKGESLWTRAGPNT
jgi:RNA polymerase sigma-54 factor